MRFALLSSLFLSTAALAATSPVPQIVVIEGRLLEGSDKPVTGLTAITFGLYRSSVRTDPPDTAVWTETYQVLCGTTGLFSIKLGAPQDAGGATDKKPFDATTFAPGQPLYLESTVGGSPMTPRLQIGSTPFAMLAAAAANADTLGGNGPDFYAKATDAAAKVASVTATAPVVVGGTATAPAISIPAASATADGFLSKTDFAVFAAKQGALTATPPITLDNTGHLSLDSTVPLLSGSAAFDGAVSAASISSTGNITVSGGGKFVGDGSGLTGVVPTAPTFTGTVTGGAFTTAGNVTATGTGKFVGSGAGLTGIPAAAITGAVPNALALNGATFPATKTKDSTTDIKAYMDRRLCEYRNGTWSDTAGCTEPIKLSAASVAPASIDWAYDNGSCGAGFHVCMFTEYFEYIAIIRRMNCPSGMGFNGGWPVTEPEDRNQMFHGHGNSGTGNFQAGPPKGVSGQLFQTQGSNGTGCALSINTGNGAQPLWCCVNRASNL